MVPTIRDVAKRAGVSIATVSRVLNNSAVVTEAKRAKVTSAARELGYRPNPAAVSLRAQSVGGIGVLLPFLAGDFFSEFLYGIDRYTSENDLFLMVTSLHRNPDEFRSVLESLHRRVDGLIVMSTEVPAREVCEWVPGDTPIVFVNTDVAGLDVDAVNFDNRGGAKRMTEHLLDAGYRRIAHIQGSAGAWDAKERSEGFREALAERGLEPAFETPGDYTMESGEGAAAQILALDPRPDAIFAANDDSAFGALAVLREAGVSLPDEMGLAGFDDVKLSQVSMPSLTTVRVPTREIGRAAIERLAARLEGATSPRRETLFATEVVARESTRTP